MAGLIRLNRPHQPADPNGGQANAYGDGGGGCDDYDL